MSPQRPILHCVEFGLKAAACQLCDLRKATEASAASVSPSVKRRGQKCLVGERTMEMSICP